MWLAVGAVESPVGKVGSTSWWAGPSGGWLWWGRRPAGAPPAPRAKPLRARQPSQLTAAFRNGPQADLMPEYLTHDVLQASLQQKHLG